MLRSFTSCGSVGTATKKQNLLISLAFRIFPPHLFFRCGDRSSVNVRKFVDRAPRQSSPVGGLRVERCHSAAAQRGVFPGNGNAVYEERNCDECSPSERVLDVFTPKSRLSISNFRICLCFAVSGYTA